MRSFCRDIKLIGSHPDLAGAPNTVMHEHLFAFTCYSHRFIQVLLTLEDLSQIIYRHRAALPRTGSVEVIKTGQLPEALLCRILNL